VKAQPELIALRCTEAGMVEKPVNYRLKVGQQALARSTLIEAVKQLKKGLGPLLNQPFSALATGP
jgi:hypothetical protein